MVKDKIVQFVCFETTLDSNDFMARWDLFNRSDKADQKVTMHQSEHNGSFSYLAQHCCTPGALQFTFTKAKASRTAAASIKTVQAGGYIILQQETTTNLHSQECKIFAFIIDPTTDLTVYRQLTAHNKLNIYQAYYENCKYAYILEFVVKNKYAELLKEQLKPYYSEKIHTYKELSLQSA